MEPDRYGQNSKLFVMGILSLLLSLSLLAFSFFILPFLIWNLHYNVPEFISNWREWLKEAYNLNELIASGLVFLMFAIPAAGFGYLSYWISNRVDNEIYGIRPQKTAVDIQKKREIKESFSVGFKLTLLILLFIGAIAFIQWVLIT